VLVKSPVDDSKLVTDNAVDSDTIEQLPLADRLVIILHAARLSFKFFVSFAVVIGATHARKTCARKLHQCM